MKTTIKMLSAAVAITALMAGCADPILPTPDFSYEPTEVKAYDLVTFTNMSTDADTYAWTFDVDASSTDENPTHTFMAAGTYTVKLVATNVDGESEIEKDIVVGEADKNYQIDDTTYNADADMFWYQSSMGGDPYLRLLTSVDGQDNPDLLKLYPNKGLNELPGTYTWDAENPAGTYDCGYTANYAGMSYDWTAVGKTGSGDLVITELETGVYKVEGEMILSIGSFNFMTGEFTETAAANLTVNYVGAITPL
ncbi:PKD domain-containing protein [Bacteroidota bacterium]